MENGLSRIAQTSLTTISRAVILKEQEPKETKKAIALLLQRLSKLYQIPNWTEENAILLTEWIHENYKYETMDVIMNVLTNPPNTGKTWRLTPDTIQEWMTIELEKQAERREKEHEKMKIEKKNEEIVIPDVDFSKVMKGTWLESYMNHERKKEEGFAKFKTQFYNGRQSDELHEGKMDADDNDANV